MANCEISIDKYIPIVRNFIKLDSEKYKNFDEISKFILNSGLSNAEQYLSLNNIASIYIGLHGLDNSFYEIGSANKVLDLKSLEPEQFLSVVSSFYTTKKPSSLKLETIESKIKKLAGEKFILRNDLTDKDGVLTYVKNYFNTTIFENLEERSAILQDITSSLNDVVKALTTPEDQKKGLYKQIADTINSLEKKSEFISINEIEELAELKTVLVTMKNGQMVEAINRPQGLVVIDELGNEETINKLDVLDEKLARREDISNTNRGEQEFTEDTLSSNFQIKAVSQEPFASQKLHQKLNSMTNPLAGIRIHAIKLSSVGDDRINRMQALAVSNPQYGALANRTYETFENNTQINYLKSTAKGTILTVSRPKQSDDVFAIVGEILSTGEKFYLHPLSNFVFLNSDNTTEKVDFSNDAHLERVKKHSLLRKEDELVELSTSNLEQLKTSFEQYKSFKQTVSDYLDKNLSDGLNSIDVSSLFFAQYSITNREIKKSEVSKEPLSTSIENIKSLSKSLTIVTFNSDGTIATEEVRKIPFMFVKRKDKRTFDEKNRGVLAPEFTLTPLLNKNEKIKVTDENGNVIDYVSQTDYVTDGHIAPGINFNEDFIKNTIFKNNQRSYGNVTHMIVRFNNAGTYGWREIEPLMALSEVQGFATFMTSLGEVLTSSNKTGLLQSFNNNVYSFKNLTTRTGEKGVYVNFTRDKNSNLQIEIRPQFKIVDGVRVAKYFFTGDEATKQDFNFSLTQYDSAIHKENEEKLISIAKNLSEGPLVKKVIAENPIFSQLDMTKKSDVIKFYTTLTQMSKEKHPSQAITALVESIEKDREDFANMLIDRVVKPLTKVMNSEKYAKYKAMFDEDFPDPEFLIVAKDDNGNNIPRIEFSPNNSSQEKADFTNNLDNISLKEIPRAEMIVTSKSVTAPSIAIQKVKNAAKPLSETQHPIENKPVGRPAKPVADPESPVQQTFDSSEIAEEEIFSIEGSGIITESEAERQSSIDLINEILPQFKISKSEISEIVDLSKIDGTVLGLFKDKVIYLNEQLKSKGVVYHEAFHGVFRYLLDADTRNAIVEQVTNNKRYEKLFTPAALKEFADKRNYLYNYDKMKQLQAEEILADGFQNHMNKNTKSKGLIGMLHELLKKLIAMFSKHGNEIDNLYGEIRRGSYSKKAISSNIYDGQVAFEMIYGLKEVKPKRDGNGVVQGVSTLVTAQQNQLEGFMAAYIVENTSGQTFDEKFEIARKMLLNNVFNIDRIIEQKPELKDIAIKNYGALYSQYRFMLGARMDGETVYDINLSGDPKHDKLSLNNKVDTYDGKGVQDNDLGQVSVETLKKLVKARVRGLYSILDGVGLKAIDKENIINELTGANEKKSKDNPDFEDEQEVSGDVNTDESFNEHNRLESAPRQIRRFLAIIEYQKEDENGFKIPRIINGESLFGSLLKISSDIEPGRIINQLQVTANIYREDGNIEAANDLQAVYDKISKYIGSTSGNPATNKQLYNMFVDVLHGTKIDYMLVSPKLKTTELGGSYISDFTIKDQVLSTDLKKKKTDLIASMIVTHTKSKNDSKYLDAVKVILQASEKIIKSSSVNPLMSKTLQSNEQLEQLTNDLHSAFNTVGIKVSKSLVRISLLAIDKNDNSNTLLQHIDQKTLDHYENDKAFVEENALIQKEWFRDIREIYKNVNGEKTSITSNAFARMLDDKNPNMRRFNSVVGKFSKYLLKYDATELPSIIKNAAGKSIYPYTKYTPLILTAQNLRREGLQKTLEKDSYYEDFLKTYYEDSSWFGDLLAGKDTVKAKQAKLLIENMNVQLFGGVTQMEGQSFREGKVFGKLDDQSLYLSSIFAFLQRSTLGTKEDNIQTFTRMFSTLESSQTNFLVTGLYNQYANRTGVLKNGKYYKIVDELQAKVNQEYNRIKNEHARKDTLKRNFDDGSENLLVNKYNAVLDTTDKTKANVDDKSLRAYTFNSFPDFWSDPENEELKQLLIDSAKAGVEFSTIDASSMEDLKAGLHNYADNKLNLFYDELVKLKVVDRVEQKRLKLLKDKSTGKVELNENGNPIVVEMTNALGQPAKPITFLTSNLIADKFKLDSSSSQIASDYYARSEENYNEVGMPMSSVNLEGMLADFYFNYFANSMNVNELFDGDLAMNVTSVDNYIKRNKKLLASGSTLKEGFHTVAYLNTIKGYINQKYPEYGPYYSKEEIASDPKLTDQERDYISENFDLNSNEASEILDGQSFSTLMHQIDIHDTQGRLTPEILYSLISKHYRKLTAGEVREMEKNKIVNNPKKTVTAAKNSYHKLSESYIDRLDVSMIVMPEGMTDIEDVYDILHGYYVDIYDKRTEIQERHKINDISGIAELQSEISEMYKKIHDFYEPLPHRKKLHDILNSMEVHNVDQIMDTTSSKQATKLPVDYFAHENHISGYLPLDISSIRINNAEKYLQVETSGIHDTARFSVQGKILLPADIVNIKQIAEKRHLEAGTVMSESEKDAMNNLSAILNRYQESLFDISNSNLTSLKSIMRKGGDFDMGKIFNLIRENLEEQKAPLSALSLFAVDAAGKPVHSPNLPGIRSMLEYYFFSVYSKHVTDEKGSGFKNILVSSFGYEVLEDVNGNIVTTEEYQKNPSKYGQLKSRPLGVKIEEGFDSDGNPVTKYFVECILPKNFFRSKQHEEFYKKNLTEMFALRIPTEDKRSMIALKVVDYVDSSNMNSIIVPHFITLLSGSDFDIDSLYGQTFAHYATADGIYHKYGEYDNYSSEKNGKYLEYLHYMKSDSNFSRLIKQTRANITSEGKFNPSANALEAMYMMGYTQEDYINAFSSDYFNKLEDEADLLAKDLDEMSGVRNADKQEYVDWKNKTEESPEDQNAWRHRKYFGAIIADQLTAIKTKQNELTELQKAQNRLKDFVYNTLEIESALQVFEKYDLPVNIDTFENNPMYGLSVIPVHQNKNLQAKLDLMTNEAVFKNLYIHERSSVQFAEDICDQFGRPLKSFNKNIDHYSISSVVHYKRSGSSYKDGIGIAASIQKFLALASANELELSDKNIIWQFVSEDVDSTGGTIINKNKLSKFGSINSKGQRVIEINGNILGMFADGMTKPIPASLNMNEINTGVTLAMIGVGILPEMAIAFNFFPEVISAVNSVQASRFAISDTISDGVKFLNTEVNEQINAYISKNLALSNDIITELKSAGLLTPDSTLYKRDIIKDNLLINFNAKPFGNTTEDMTPGEIGFEVASYIGNTKTSLSEGAQKVILLELYKQQAAQAWNIRSAGSIVDLYKKLNPSLVAFDRLYKNINELREGVSIFTPESSVKLFKGKQGWVPLVQALDDLYYQASKIFLERTPFFQPIKNAFSTVYTDSANIAKTIVSFIALTKYRTSMPGSRKSNDPNTEANFREDDNNLIQAFTADYWYENTLATELEDLKAKYPENKFLQYITEAHSDSTALDISGNTVSEKTLQLVSKSKVNGELADTISNDAYNLMFKENMFMKKLFYHELAKTGLGYKSGSFLQFLPANLQLPLSENITEFISRLETANGSSREIIDTLKEFMGSDQISTDEDVYDMFDQLFTLMAYGASTEVGNRKIKIAEKLSFNDSTEVQYKSALLKLLTEGTASEKQAIAKELVGKILGLNVNASQKSLTYNSETFQNDFTIDFKSVKDNKYATPEALTAIAKTLQIMRSKEDQALFQFPMMIRMKGDGSTYLLQGVDDEISNNSIGKSIIETIAGSKEFNTVGSSAKYILLPSNLTTGTLSPIAFDVKQSQRFMNLTTKKERLESEVDMSFGLTADSFEDYSIKPAVEISSNAKGLAGALTNPTELAKSKGNIKQSYPVDFRGVVYKDAEAAYQALKGTATKDAGPNNTYNLMVDIIKAKLQQHPILTNEINKKGGSAWILSSTHQPTKQNSVWETGGQNWFIKSLNDAYLSVTKSSVKEKTTLESDIQNLNLTFEVMNALYQDSSKRKSLEEFSKDVAGLVAKLRSAGSTNEKILENIKCL